jgi:hypothetical protein
VKIEDIRKLHQKKFREEAGLFLLEGEHLVLELQKAATRNPQLLSCEIYCTREYEHWRSPFTMHQVKSVQMQQISETRTPQGIVAVAPLLTPPPPRPGEKAVYLQLDLDVHTGQAVRASSARRPSCRSGSGCPSGACACAARAGPGRPCRHGADEQREALHLGRQRHRAATVAPVRLAVSTISRAEVSIRR